MNRKTIAFFVVGLVVLTGLVYGAFLAGRNSTVVALSSTSECQPADSPWCQNLIPGCRPITAKRCQQPTGWNPDPYGIRQPTLEQRLEVLKTWLGFGTAWLMVMLLFIAWLVNRKTGAKDED